MNSGHNSGHSFGGEKNNLITNVQLLRSSSWLFMHAGMRKTTCWSAKQQLNAEENWFRLVSKSRDYPGSSSCWGNRLYWCQGSEVTRGRLVRDRTKSTMNQTATDSNIDLHNSMSEPQIQVWKKRQNGQSSWKDAGVRFQRQWLSAEDVNTKHPSCRNSEKSTGKNGIPQK